MFTRIFGKPKQANTLATLDKLTETLEMLDNKEIVLMKKAAAEVEKAKQYTRATNKRAVIQCLKRKMLYEQQVKQLENFHIEDAKATTKTLNALRSGATDMKAMQKPTNIDDVDKTMDEINEQTEYMKQARSRFKIGGCFPYESNHLIGLTIVFHFCLSLFMYG